MATTVAAFVTGRAELGSSVDAQPLAPRPMDARPVSRRDHFLLWGPTRAVRPLAVSEWGIMRFFDYVLTTLCVCLWLPPRRRRPTSDSSDLRIASCGRIVSRNGDVSRCVARCPITPSISSGAIDTEAMWLPGRNRFPSLACFWATNLSTCVHSRSDRTSSDASRDRRDDAKPYSPPSCVPMVRSTSTTLGTGPPQPW